MITSRQVRAARALLNWTQEMLADEALVALTALKRLESENNLPVREDARHQVVKALEDAGIVFLDSAGRAFSIPKRRISSKVGFHVGQKYFGWTSYRRQKRKHNRSHNSRRI